MSLLASLSLCTCTSHAQPSQKEKDKKVKLRSTWDHCPVYATIQEDDGQGYAIEKKKGVGHDVGRVTKNQELISKRP